METLIWMGAVGVSGMMILIVAAHALYQKVRDWWRHRRAGG